MANFEEMVNAAILRLHDFAQTRKSGAEDITGAELKDAIAQVVGGGYAPPIFSNLVDKKFLRKIYNTTDNRDGLWVFTSDFIMESDKTFSNTQMDNEQEGEFSPRRFTSFCDLIVVALYRHGDGIQNLKELADQNGIQYLDGWPDQAAKYLDDNGYALVSRTLGGDKEAAAKLNAHGMILAEKLIDADVSLPKTGVEPVTVSGELVVVSSSDSDTRDKWEPLPIDRSSPEYSEAVSKTDEALQVIEGDNGFASSLPEMRDHVVWSLGAGVNALKEGLLTKEQVDSLLICPLKWVATKFAEGLMKIAANKALIAILAWLKSVV